MFIYGGRRKRPAWNRDRRRISLNVPYYLILALETFMFYMLKHKIRSKENNYGQQIDKSHAFCLFIPLLF